MIKIVLLFLFTSLSIAKVEVFIDDSPSQQSNLSIIMSKMKHLKIQNMKQRELKIFYDTSDLSLLNKDVVLYYQAKELSNKKNKPIYEENIRFLDNQFPVKHYSNIQSKEEKNPLLFLVKRSQRELFKVKLQDINITNPMSIKAVFALAKIVNTVALPINNNKNIILIIEQVRVTVFSNDIEYIVYRFENHNNNTLDKVKDELNKFKPLSKESNDYKILYDVVQKKVNLLNIKLQYPSLINLFNALLLGLIGCIVIFILIKKVRNE